VPCGESRRRRAAAPVLHAKIPDACWRGPWVVHSQPAGSGTVVARYVFRTAISDERIDTLDDHHVVFHCTDSETKRRRTCRLEADEFMRRYLQHVPPEGFHRARYFAWMHPAAKRRRAIVETLLEALIVPERPQEPPLPWHLRCPHCPHCQASALIAIERLKPQARAPPR